MTTHLGQAIRSHVTLEIVGGINNGYGPGKLGFLRRTMEGATEGGPGGGSWQVPAASALVLTDIDWTFHHPNGASAAGELLTLRLWLVAGADAGSRMVEISAVLGAAGGAGGNVNLTAGAVFGPGTRIGVDTNLGSGLQFLLLRGYLMSLR